jgi:hypothetical protein
MSKVIAEAAGTTAAEPPPAAGHTPAIPLDGRREENWWSALNALDLAVYTPAGNSTGWPPGRKLVVSAQCA